MFELLLLDVKLLAFTTPPGSVFNCAAFVKVIVPVLSVPPPYTFKIPPPAKLLFCNVRLLMVNVAPF